MNAEERAETWRRRPLAGNRPFGRIAHFNPRQIACVWEAGFGVSCPRGAESCGLFRFERFVSTAGGPFDSCLLPPCGFRSPLHSLGLRCPSLDHKHLISESDPSVSRLYARRERAVTQLKRRNAPRLLADVKRTGDFVLHTEARFIAVRCDER